MATTIEVISTKLTSDGDDAVHGTSLIVAPGLSSEFGVHIMLSPSNSTESCVVLPADLVYIPWAFTRPWLDPVPPHPPDQWSPFHGAWFVSGAVTAITMQLAAKTVQSCNAAEEVPSFVWSDEVQQPGPILWPPWPPPPAFCEKSIGDELQEIFCNSASIDLQTCISNCLRGTILAVLESHVMHYFLDSQSRVSPLHICLHNGLDREENFTSLQHNDLDDQFNSPSISLNVLETFMKKRCTETEEATVSGLISKGATSVPKRWHIPWFSFGFLELPSEEPYCLSLFQWEIAWQPQAEGECFDIGVYCGHGNNSEACPSPCMAIVMLLYRDYSHLQYNHHICCWYALKPGSPLMRMGYLYWLLHEQAYMGADVLEMQCIRCLFLVQLAVTTYRRARPMELPDVLAPVVSKFQQLHLLYYYQASKLRVVPVLELQGSTCNPFSPGTCQARKGASICSGFTFCSHFHMCMGMRAGELLQWLANNLWGSDVSIIQSLQDEDQLWTLVNLNGEFDQHRKSQLDPRSCSSVKQWITPMHYYAKLQWSSLQLAGAVRIWLVAWTVDGLEFSMGHEQAPFQGGRNVIQVAFSVHVRHKYCVTFVNHAPIGYDYYFDQTYYFTTVCSDTISYHQDSHDDTSNTKEGHMPWDPGKLVLHYHRKVRLGDKPSFKERGMLGAFPYPTGTGTWTVIMGHHMGLAQHDTQEKATYTSKERIQRPSGWIRTKRRRRLPLSHLGSYPLPLSCLFVCTQIS